LKIFPASITNLKTKTAAIINCKISHLLEKQQNLSKQVIGKQKMENTIPKCRNGCDWKM